MSSNLPSTTVKSTPKILCYYTNSSPKIQILRIINTENYNLEKVIFPRQRMLFEATVEGQIEIHTSQIGEKQISQIIPCQNLRVDRVELNSITDDIDIQQHKSA